MSLSSCTVYITTTAGDEYVLDGWVPEHYSLPWQGHLGFVRVEDVTAGDGVSVNGWAYDLSQVESMRFRYNEDAGFTAQPGFVEEEPSIWHKAAAAP